MVDAKTVDAGVDRDETKNENVRKENNTIEGKDSSKHKPEDAGEDRNESKEENNTIKGKDSSPNTMLKLMM